MQRVKVSYGSIEEVGLRLGLKFYIYTITLNNLDKKFKYLIVCHSQPTYIKYTEINQCGGNTGDLKKVIGE